MVWFVMGGWVGWFDRWVAGGLVGWVDGVLLEAFLAMWGGRKPPVFKSCGEGRWVGG